MHSIRAFLSAVFATLPLAAQAATFYTVTELGFSPSDINNRGQVVGNTLLWESGKGTTHLGFRATAINDSGQVVGGRYLWDPSTGVTDLGDLTAYDINNLGQVVGSIRAVRSADLGYGDVEEVKETHPFVWDSHSGVTDLGLIVTWLGGNYPPLWYVYEDHSYATSINDYGQIVGNTTAFYADATMPFLVGGSLGSRPGQSFWSPQPGGYSRMYGNDINNLGQVVGCRSTRDALCAAYIWDTEFIDLGPPPGYQQGDYDYSDAVGINDSGQVVGGFWGRYGRGAFLWELGTGMVDLNDLIDPSLGWDLYSVSGINNLGQMVGYGTNPDGVSTGYLLTPYELATVPLPPALPLLAVGAGALALIGRNRRAA